MNYDWQAQAYASGPRLSGAGKKHRAAYLKRWKKRMDDPVELDHLDALKDDEAWEKKCLESEKVAIDAARTARDSVEMEEVPPELWKAGDIIECTHASNRTYTVGMKYIVKGVMGRDGYIKVSDNFVVNHPDSDCMVKPHGSVEKFRLLRPKRKTVDLSKAPIGSKWKTRGGWCATYLGERRVDHGIEHIGVLFHKQDTGALNADMNGARDYDIVGPWID